MWAVLALIFSLWTAVWIWFAVRLAGKPMTVAIGALANLLPPVTILTCATVLILLPVPLVPPSPVARAIHYCGITLLFAFLVFGAYCQAEAWTRLRREHPLHELGRTYRKWWVATKLIPAAAAICILLSGMRLFYEGPPGANLQNGWMFWLIVSFTFFFVDGLVFYLPTTGRQFKAVVDALRARLSVSQYCQKNRSPWAEAMLLFHSISFSFVFALAIAQPKLPYPDAFVGFLARSFSAWSAPAARVGEMVAVVFTSAGVVLLARGTGWLVKRR